MSKKRILDSRIRSSQTFAQLTYRQRDLWQGLIAVADDQGRMPGLAAFVRSQVWPYDDIPLAEIDADLARLIELEMIVLYEAAGQVFMQLINWWKYQTPQWAGPSSYPPPPGWTDRTRYHGAEHKVISQNWDSMGGFINVTELPPDLSPEKPPDKSLADLVWKDIKEDVNEDIKEDEDINFGAGAPENPEASQKARIVAAISSGATMEERIRDDIYVLFSISPNWDTKGARAFMGWAKNLPPGQTLQIFSHWWYSAGNWRSGDGHNQPPTLGQIREFWPQAFKNGRYRPPDQDDSPIDFDAEAAQHELMEYQLDYWKKQIAMGARNSREGAIAWAQEHGVDLAMLGVET